MYRGFNLSLDPETEPFKIHRTRGERLMKERWPKLTPDLAALSESETIDGDKVMGDWFQQVNANVFISHSHNDLALAHGLAGYLHDRLGLLPFVDSFVWNSADGLLREFDDLYCRSPEGSSYRYDYKQRNYSTSHVHMMLAASLSEAIDRCECVIFLNTPESIQIKDAKERASEMTASPWIYHELNTSRLIRRNKVARPRMQTKSMQVEAYAADSASLEMRIEYKAHLAHLAPVAERDLLAWETDVLKMERLSPGFRNGGKALDILYRRHADPNPSLLAHL